MIDPNLLAKINIIRGMLDSLNKEGSGNMHKVLVNIRTIDWESGNVQFDTTDDGGFAKFDAVDVMLNSMCTGDVVAEVVLRLIDTSNNVQKVQEFRTNVGDLHRYVHTLAELMVGSESWGAK